MRLIQLDPALADPDRLARRLRFSPDGRSLAAVLGPYDGRRVVVRYDLHRDTDTVIPEPNHEDDTREDAPDPAVSPDLELVAEVLLGDDGNDLLRVTDTWAKPPEVRDRPGGAGRLITGVGFVADAGVLCVGLQRLPGERLEVARYDVGLLLGGDEDHPDTADLTPLLTDADGEAETFADSPDGRTLAVGTSQGAAVLFDLTGTRRPLALPAVGRRRRVGQLAFTPDGLRLVTCGTTEVAVWDVATGGELVRFTTQVAFTGFALTPDGQHLFTSSRDGTVCRFAADFSLADRLTWGQGPLHSVAVAPDGLTAAAGAGGGRVVVWDL